MKKHSYKLDHIQRKERILKARKELDDEIDDINTRLNNLASNNYIDPDITDAFASLPILKSTKNALYKNNFNTMTPIQRQTLPVSLTGRDLIGAAETGTGKTLAFLIPLIEALKKAHWTNSSGLGAIIISPTRDLAAQTFRVLKSLLPEAEYTIGLITGGLDFDSESAALPKCNIAVTTLGRLREHVESTPEYNADKVKFLVIDEADRILVTKDFMKDLKIILSSLPDSRQTLLFTATASSALKQITRISLKNPVRVILTDLRSSATPDNLAQFYSIVPISQKLNALFSFLKTHNSDKIIVFFETRKLARFTFEAFRHLKPGLPLILLTGKQKEQTRFAASTDFTTKERAALFTTDVCARGIDFPAVDWVVQFDCPSKTETYIHRVGRTARYHAKGKSLMFLLPSEKAFIPKLAEAKVNVTKQKISGAQLIDTKSELVSILAKFPECRQLAIKAFTTYLQSVQLHEDGEVFKLDAIIENKDEFAGSLGLIQVPIISFADKRKKKNVKVEEKALKGGEEDENEDEHSSMQPYKQEVEKEINQPELDFMEPVESDWEDDEEVEEAEIVPTTIEYLEAGTPIPMNDFNQWRNRLKDLLHVSKSKQQKEKTHIKKQEEEPKPIDISQQAELDLLGELND